MALDPAGDEQPAPGQVNADVDLENDPDAQPDLNGDDLLPEEQPDLPPPVVEGPQVAPEGGNGGAGIELGEAHQALLQRQGPTGFEPYHKPSYFPLRVRKTANDLLSELGSISSIVLHSISNPS